VTATHCSCQHLFFLFSSSLSPKYVFQWLLLQYWQLSTESLFWWECNKVRKNSSHSKLSFFTMNICWACTLCKNDPGTEDASAPWITDTNLYCSLLHFTPGERGSRAQQALELKTLDMNLGSAMYRMLGELNFFTSPVKWRTFWSRPSRSAVKIKQSSQHWAQHKAISNVTDDYPTIFFPRKNLKIKIFN
jgi:hypothetical protein